MEDVTGHPKLGASWEGFAMEELLKFIKPDEAYFWNTVNRAELDLLMIKDGKPMGFEFKYSSSSRVTPSMRIALQDLKLDHLTVIVPKGEAYPLSSTITVSGLCEYIAF